MACATERISCRYFRLRFFGFRNYITLQPGDGDSEDEFIAEEQGPIAQVNPGDLLIHLISDDLGSISIGASVYFKKMPVGKIYDYRFNKDNKVEIDVVIDKASRIL